MVRWRVRRLGAGQGVEGGWRGCMGWGGGLCCWQSEEHELSVMAGNAEKHTRRRCTLEAPPGCLPYYVGTWHPLPSLPRSPMHVHAPHTPPPPRTPKHHPCHDPPPQVSALFAPAVTVEAERVTPLVVLPKPIVSFNIPETNIRTDVPPRFPKIQPPIVILPQVRCMD